MRIDINGRRGVEIKSQRYQVVDAFLVVHEISDECGVIGFQAIFKGTGSDVYSSRLEALKSIYRQIKTNTAIAPRKRGRYVNQSG